MLSFSRFVRLLPLMALLLLAWDAQAQSFRVQCPTHTALHPLVNAAGVSGRPDSTLPNPHIKCQQISGGDGFATMGDGTQTYLFAFGPLSGLSNMVQGLPGTVTAAEFNQNNLDTVTGIPLDVIKIGAPYPGYTFNGAIGLVPDVEANNGTGTAGALLTGHVDPRLIMDVGVLNGNIPAPLIAIDEGDELFLTLTNVGQVMRPDLFEQHTVHFHGYAERLGLLRRRARRLGGHQHRRQLHVLLPGARGRHLHVALPHLAAGAPADGHGRPDLRAAEAELGSRATCAPRCKQPMWRRRVPAAAMAAPPAPTSFARVRHRCRPMARPRSPDGKKYAYNDGDGSTAYDVEYPIQMHGFDPNFHFVGMTFNPESFADNKDKYFLLNGRSYPDTINPEPDEHPGHRRRAALLAAAADRHQHPGGRQGAAADLRSQRHRVPHAGLARHPDARHRPATRGCCATRTATTWPTTRTRSRSVAASRST